MKKKQVWKICSLLFSAAVAATALPTGAAAAGVPPTTEDNPAGTGQEKQAEFALSGQLFNATEDYESAYREAEVTEEKNTYQKQEWTVVNLTFESSDASKTARNLLRFRITAQEEDIVEMGTSYSSSTGKISSPLEQAVGGDNIFYSKENNSSQALAAGNGPAQAKKTLYCTVTHGDGTISYYMINVLRKGYKGAQTGSNGDCYRFMNFDATNEWFADMEMYTGMYLAGDTYDDDGKRNGALQWEPIAKDKTKNIMWIEDDTIFARRAGIEPMYKASYNGEDYYVTAMARYKKNDARTLLDRRKTDGITDLSDFTGKDAFVAEYPSGQKENAGTFFELVTGLDEILTANKSELSPGGWDYLTYQGGVNWTEECESAKLNKVMDMAPEVWENIYDKKGTKEAIQNYVNLEKYPLEQRAKLQAIIDKYTAQVDTDYESKVIKSMADTHAILENAKQEMDAVKIPFDNCKAVLDASSIVYDGTEKEPAVRVTGPDQKELSPEEYTVAYENNIHAGEAKVTVTGAGTYSGAKTLTFTIGKAAQAITTEKTVYTCTAGDQPFSLKASVNSGKALSYSSSDTAAARVSADGMVTPLKEGTAVITVKADGDNDYLEQTATVNIQVRAKAEVKDPQGNTGNQGTTQKPGEKDPQGNTGNQGNTQKPAEDKLLSVSKKCYTKTEGDKAFSLGAKAAEGAAVTYKTDAKAVATVNTRGKVMVKGPGCATITVTAKAKDGKVQSEKITVDVKPSAKLGLGVKAGKKRLQITWKSNRKVNGYEITVATDKKFKKVAQKVTVKKAKTGKATVKKLKAGKKYYVRIRSYKKVKGRTLYSNWTKAKTGKPKK